MLTLGFRPLTVQEIDESQLVIRGVSVLTVGEARGHGLRIDAQTLVEVKAAAETYAGGLKVKLDHYSGFNEIVGALKNFVIDGDQLRADLHLLTSHEATPRILEMAQVMPDTFGLSISFTGTPEEKDGVRLARCSEIYSADLVDAPAANPSGLFSARVDTRETNMDAKEFAEALESLNTKMAAFEAFMADASAKLSALAAIEPEKEAEAPESEKSEDMSAATAALSAELAEIKTLLKNFGAAPVSAGIATETKKQPAITTFAEAVKATGLSGTAAIKAAIASHPELYAAERCTGIKL